VTGTNTRRWVAPHRWPVGDHRAIVHATDDGDPACGADLDTDGLWIEIGPDRLDAITTGQPQMRVCPGCHPHRASARGDHHLGETTVVSPPADAASKSNRATRPLWSTDMTQARRPTAGEILAASRDPRLLLATQTSPDHDWRTRGACRDADPELFHPLPTEDTSAALDHCARCPVQPACLRVALDLGDVDGIWGATTPRERRAMRIALRNQQSAATT
jgi:WhiB family redox-sensing transcriptional regulator